MGYLIEVDGAAAEVRWATLHSVCSRAIWWNRDREITSWTLKDQLRYREQFEKDASINKLVDAFSSGEDVHKYTAALMLGKDVSEVTSDERKDAKTVSLGRMYKRGAAAIAAQYGIDPDEMRKRVAIWDNHFAPFIEWHKSCESFVKEYGFVTSLFGLSRRLPDIYNSDDMWVHKAIRLSVNAPVQGDSHIWISKSASHFIQNYSDKPGNRAIVVNDIHDALMFDVPDNELDNAVISAVEGFLHFYFDHDKYPFVVCDLACDLAIDKGHWGNSVLGEHQFDTSRMKDKHRPDFNLREAIAEQWFKVKQNIEL